MNKRFIEVWRIKQFPSQNSLEVFKNVWGPLVNSSVTLSSVLICFGPQKLSYYCDVVFLDEKMSQLSVVNFSV